MLGATVGLRVGDLVGDLVSIQTQGEGVGFTVGDLVSIQTQGEAVGRLVGRLVGDLVGSTVVHTSVGSGSWLRPRDLDEESAPTFLRKNDKTESALEWPMMMLKVAMTSKLC